MVKISRFAILLVVFLLSINFTFVSADDNETLDFTSSDNYEKGFRFNVQGWIYLHIEGNPYERGYQHGYLLADEIVDMINRWSNIFPQKNSWNSQRKDIHRLFWNKYPKEYQDEIRGIADGVADKGGKINGNLVDYKDILALNEMYEYNSRHRNFFTQPFKTFINEFFNKLKPTAVADEHLGKCSVFIATGEATADGGIVATHMTNGHYRDDAWWQYYVTERWNVLLDIEPSDGNRILMACAPGLIWSDEDYYQNDAGMILMETSLPLGRWRRSGTPIVVRARKAIQYSNSIDEMIDIFLTKNNGLMANDWVMGDTKTGEIASLEIATRNHAITRTKNGFLWSCNNPKDDKVRWELASPTTLGIIGRITKKEFKPGPRDIKFEELKKQYYGQIDINIAKKIMSTHPINNSMFDCKIVDTKLVEDFGLWAYFGYVNGTDKMLVEKYKSLPGITNRPSCGWVSIYGLNDNNDFRLKDKKSEYKENLERLWSFETINEEVGNSIYSSPEISEDNLFFTTWNGYVYSLNLDGEKNWEKKIGWSSVSSPTANDGFVFVGSSDGIFALDKQNGDVIWHKKVGSVSCKPAVYKNMVYCGSHDGFVCALDQENGEVIWKFKTNNAIYSSPIVDNKVLYIGGNDHYFYALNAVTGEKKWEYQTKGAVRSTSCIYKKTVIFGCDDNNLYALNKKDGSIDWKFTTGWGITSSPVISKDTLFFGSLDNNLYALDPVDGVLKWFFTANAAVQSTPEVYGGYVFFGCDDGRFYALNETNGDIYWVSSPDFAIEGISNYVTKPIVSSPTAYDGKIFFGSMNGRMYSYDSWAYESLSEYKEQKTKYNLSVIILVIIIVIIFIAICVKLIKRKR